MFIENDELWDSPLSDLQIHSIDRPELKFFRVFVEDSKR